jgi:hypothetical protein
MTEDYISDLERLAKLGSGAQVAGYRRLWVVVLLTILLITFPIALIILLTGPVYRKRAKDLQPISKAGRYIYAALLALWLAAIIAKAVLHPGDWGDSAVQQPTATSSATSQSSQENSKGHSQTADTDTGVKPAGILSGFSIDASSYDKCVSKGTELVRSGTAPSEIQEYCEKRYVLHTDCTVEELKGEDLKSILLELRTIHPTDLYPEKTETDLFVTNQDPSRYLMKITYIWKDGEKQTSGENGITQGGLSPGKTFQLGSNQYRNENGDFAYYKEVELVSALVCRP